MSSVRIYRIADRTTALGPGSRAAIWFQGCHRHCEGCMSPNSVTMDGGTVWDTDTLIDRLCNVENIEGITVSGGEPFLQIEPLHEILSEIRRRKNLGVIIYTGNTMQQLKEMKNTLVDEIICSLADIIIDGEYVDELNDGGSLKGSSNQKVHFITDRYIDCQQLYEGSRRNIQIVIENENALLMGIPEKNTLEMWKEICRKGLI